MSSFSREPYGTYDQRRLEYLAFAAGHEFQALPADWKPTGPREPASQRVRGPAFVAVFPPIARFERGLALDERPVLDAVDFVEAGLDCMDFALGGLLRLLGRHGQDPLLSPALRGRIEQALTRIAYWCDEPGSPPVCWHTENHQGLWHSAELLAGERLPEARFGQAGLTGRQHADLARGRLDAWLHWRERLGWCEWLSNCYYTEDILALCNLHDFAADALLRRRAGMLLDRLMLEIALHAHRGVMGCPHGRTYANQILAPAQEGTSPISRLLSGMGGWGSASNPGAIALATSEYQPPAAILAVAADTGPVEVCQRSSIDPQDAEAHGLRYDSETDNRYFAALHAMYHPAVAPTTRAVQDRTGLYWLNPDFAEYLRQLAEAGGDWVATGMDKFLLSEANVRTFKTPHYALSSAQSFRPGGHGFQQHIWQATLDERALVFTNTPLSDGEWNGYPACFAANFVLPRVGQVRNVLIAIHRVPDAHWCASHAHWPRESFDEVVERDGWVLGRRGDGFVALYSQHPAEWHELERGRWRGWAWRTEARDNAWICEMGSAEQWGSFGAFCEAVSAAPLAFDGGRVRYGSPSLGPVEFGWAGPLTHQGRDVPLRFAHRYAAPGLAADADGLHLTVEQAGHRLELDFERHTRHP